MRGSDRKEAEAQSVPGLDLMTVEEFAALTRRTPSAVRASILRGEIPARKLGSRRYFIRRADVDRMFEGGPRA